uniref:Polysaccharide deacetylase family protein n=1 Tax=Desulfomonile tiedjei TaxID=2358 RepID=A0A7C4ATY3_9BACT
MNPRAAAKRLLKWSVEAGTALSGIGRLYRRSQYFQTGHRILTYHRIVEHSFDSHSIRPVHFKEHMAYLADHVPVVSLDDIAAHVRGVKLLTEQSAAITFDDGYKEYESIAAETLERYRLPATFFVVTGLLDRLFESAGGTYLDWNGVKALHARGFSVGSHCVRHVSLGTLSLAQAQEEPAASRRRITEELGAAPSGVSYPYGTLRDVSGEIALLAANAGYSWAATALHGLNHAGADPFLLRRTSITRGDGLKTFRMIMHGCLDPWALVDRWGYRLQRPKADMWK